MGKNQKALEYFSQSLPLSRAVGDRNGVLKVASPIYKQNFSLLTGQCLDDETVKIPTFPVRVVDDVVQVAVRKIAAFAWRSEAIALSVCSDIRYKRKPGFVFTNTIILANYLQ